MIVVAFLQGIAQSTAVRTSKCKCNFWVHITEETEIWWARGNQSTSKIFYF